MDIPHDFIKSHNIKWYDDEAYSLSNFLIPNIKDKVFYDIGAYDGLWSSIAALAGAREIHLFEPNPEPLAKAVSNVKEAGTMPVFASRAVLWSSEVPQRFNGWNVLNQFTVDQSPEYYTHTVDQYQQGSAPDFIKLDAEASEIEILKGARQTILKHRPTLMIESHDNMVPGRKDEILKLIGGLLYTKCVIVERLPTYHLFFTN